MPGHQAWPPIGRPAARLALWQTAKKREEAGRAQALAGSGQMMNEVIPCAHAMTTCMACCTSQGSQACRPGEPLPSPHLLKALELAALLLFLLLLSTSRLSSLPLFLLLSSLHPFHRLGGRDACQREWRCRRAWLDSGSPTRVHRRPVAHACAAPGADVLCCCTNKRGVHTEPNSSSTPLLTLLHCLHWNSLALRACARAAAAPRHLALAARRGGHSASCEQLASLLCASWLGSSAPLHHLLAPGPAQGRWVAANPVHKVQSATRNGITRLQPAHAMLCLLRPSTSSA